MNNKLVLILVGFLGFINLNSYTYEIKNNTPFNIKFTVNLSFGPNKSTNISSLGKGSINAIGWCFGGGFKVEGLSGEAKGVVQTKFRFIETVYLECRSFYVVISWDEANNNFIIQAAPQSDTNKKNFFDAVE